MGSQTIFGFPPYILIKQNWVINFNLALRWSTTPWTGLNTNNLTEQKNFGSKTWNDPKDQFYITSKQFQFFSANAENKEKPGAKIHLWNKGENATLLFIVSIKLYKGYGVNSLQPLMKAVTFQWSSTVLQICFLSSICHQVTFQKWYRASQSQI